jgi:hypothetical protein
MNKDKDKELDDFFRKGLEDPVDHAQYEEKDWDALEQMLDKDKKRRGIVYWLPILGTVAALLLLFLGWWAFQSNNIPRSGKSPHAQTLVKNGVNHKGSNTGTNDVTTRRNTDSKTADNQTTDNHKTIYNKQTTPRASDYANAHNNGKISTNGKVYFTVPSNDSGHGIIGSGKKEVLSVPFPETLVAVSGGPIVELSSIIARPVHSFDLEKTGYNPEDNSKNNKNIIKQPKVFRPQYALSVLAAPDINGVGSFQQSKVGTNVGLLFSAGLLRKLTISTGVLYSAKPYTMAFQNYHTPYQFQENPVNVTANCRMLDIPLNIDYQLFNKHQNKISIGTGLSSYIMLNESYKFNYADSYVTGPSNYNVPNSGKYFFGVLNLNATYQRQLNSKVGISFQPYLKLPLTNLGYGQVRLQTTGIAVGLTWNLNSLSK